jgi:SynChlorMet cassette protein ScmC
MPDVIFEIKRCKDKGHSIFAMHLSLHPIYQRAQNSGGLPFHGALVERDGMGVLLAGRGGVGKSTCCRRIKSPWIVLGDEEALIAQDKRNQYLAHPFPTWSDYTERRSERTWNVQQYFPLSAIFFLEQAGADEVVTIGQAQAAILITQAAMQVWRRVWISMNYNKDISFKNRLFENACRLAKVVPSYLLRVSLKGRFWEKIEAVLR